MTLEMICLNWNAECDWCNEEICAGEMAWWNPITKKCYHEGECQEKAEGI